jgi:hypothetical protein
MRASDGATRSVLGWAPHVEVEHGAEQQEGDGDDRGIAQSQAALHTGEALCPGGPRGG